MKDGSHDWTAEMILKFNKLHRQQPPLSFGKIAAEMSAAFNIELTKNACIGKASRLGLPTRQQSDTPRKNRGKAKMIRIRVDAPIAANIAPRQPGIGLDIYQTREGDCKWPLGEIEDRPPYRYCGAPSLLGRPYCNEHTGTATGNTKVKWT
jgi:GcrA cell cycle regulator